MASFLVDWLATVVIQALNRSIADDNLDALVAQGDRQVLKFTHCVHVPVALFDHLFDLVFDKCVGILDLFALGGLNMLPVALHKVALVCAM
eukprot:2044977-Ditylum_brightwellii.AAC.1